MAYTSTTSEQTEQQVNGEAKGRRTRFVFPVIGVALAIAALVAYMGTLVPWAMPRDPSDVLVMLSGIAPNLIARHAIWQKLMEAVIALGGTNFVWAANVFCMVVSAAAVGMMYMVVSSLVWAMTDKIKLDLWTHGKGHGHARNMSVAAGVFAAVALAFSAPYWTVATQVYADNFYLLWFLCAIFLMFKFVDSLRFSYLWVFCVLYGLGMSQTSAFLTFAPICYGLVLYTLWRNDALSVSRFVLVGVATALGFAFIFVNAWMFTGSAGYGLLEYEGYWQVLRQLVNAIVSGTGNLPRVGWMIVGGLTIAPALAVLLAGRRALNDERDWSFYLLHAAIIIITFLVMIDIRISPWRFFGLSSLQIFPYAMMAMAFGYTVAYLYSLTVYLISADTPGAARGARGGIVVLAAALCVFTVFNNRADADYKSIAFVERYADKVLDSLDGQTWILSDGVFDNVILLRAKERGIDVNTINLSQAGNKVAVKQLKSKLKNIRLQNSVDVGMVPLVTEWITNDPDATKDLALSFLPDFWNMGNYEVYTHGLLFLGADLETFNSLKNSDVQALYLEILDDLGPMLTNAPEDMTDINEFYKNRIVERMSFVGNNLGFMLETMGRKEEAFELYSRVHAFDPQNVSALLNYVTMIQKGMHPELKEKALQELEDFHRNLSTKIDVWRLSRVYGYVSAPEVFAQLGWTWAMSGQSNLALRSLNRAMSELQPEQAGKMREILANVHMLNSDFEAGEAVFLDILAEDPGDNNAILGLLRLYILDGNFDKAREFLKRAQAAGVPRVRIMQDTIFMYIMAGEMNDARLLVAELVTLEPDNPDIHSLMNIVYAQLYANAKTDEERKETLEGMEKSIAEIERLVGADEYQTYILKAKYADLTNDYTTARENFEKALRKIKNPAAVVPLMTEILRMDYALVNKQAAMNTAKMILHRDPKNAFANYILGSLALDREDYASAEDYLRQSMEKAESVVAMNDLAVAKFQLGKLDEAEAIVRKILEKDKHIYEAWDTLALIEMQQRNYDDAEDALNAALKIQDSDLRVHLHMAQVLYRKQDLEKSREIVRRLMSSADSFTGAERRELDELSRLLLVNTKE